MIERIPFGRTGRDGSRVIFGAAALGAMRQDRADAILELLMRFGINHIDTAASYGESELRVGAWMSRHRDRFFLATKTGERGHAGAKASIEASRRRLKVDCIDLMIPLSVGYDLDNGIMIVDIEINRFWLLATVSNVIVWFSVEFEADALEAFGNVVG